MSEETPVSLDGLRLQPARRKELTENVLQICRKQYILGCCVPVVTQSMHMYAFMHACIWILSGKLFREGTCGAMV